MMRSLKNKIYYPLAWPVHLFCSLKAFVGRKCMVMGYYDKGRHKLLKRCRIASTATITYADKLSLSDNVRINHYARIDASGGVTIGEGCQIGYASCILSHSSHNAIRLMGYHFMEYAPGERVGYIFKPVHIGAYTFVGGGSYIMPGVTVGRGCVIGVNSVVTRDVPDYSIVVGSPARVIGSTKEIDKQYFDNEIVKNCYYEADSFFTARHVGG